MTAAVICWIGYFTFQGVNTHNNLLIYVGWVASVPLTIITCNKYCTERQENNIPMAVIVDEIDANMIITDAIVVGNRV